MNARIIGFTFCIAKLMTNDYCILSAPVFSSDNSPNIINTNLYNTFKLIETV